MRAVKLGASVSKPAPSQSSCLKVSPAEGRTGAVGREETESRGLVSQDRARRELCAKANDVRGLLPTLPGFWGELIAQLGGVSPTGW